MSKILSVFHLDDPASLKRFIVLIASTILVLLSPLLGRFGLPVPSDAALEVFAAIVSAFLLQSGAKSVAAAISEGKAAADTVDTTAKADAVINEATKP